MSQGELFIIISLNHSVYVFIVNSNLYDFLYLVLQYVINTMSLYILVVHNYIQYIILVQHQVDYYLKLLVILLILNIFEHTINSFYGNKFYFFLNQGSENNLLLLCKDLTCRMKLFHKLTRFQGFFFRFPIQRYVDIDACINYSIC